MAISIPFPLPAAGYAMNSKVRVNLDFLVDKFNEFNSGTATWDTVAVGTGGALTGVITLYNSSNLNYLSLQAGVTSPSITYTLPIAPPTSDGAFLKSTTAGTMSWSSLKDITSFTGNELLYLNGVTGAITELAQGTGNKLLTNSAPPSWTTIAGTTNQVNIAWTAGPTLTFSLPQSIDATASPTFAGMMLEGGTAANPSLVIYKSPSATNTGLYATANIINFSTTGVRRAYIDATDGIVSDSGVFAAGEVRGATLRVDSATGTGVQIQTAASTSWTWTLPTNDGDAGQVLQTDGAGVTSWETIAAVTDHNSLTGLQGGTAAEYYHLTSAQHTIATQAASTSVSGYVTAGDQSFTGGKTFSQNVVGAYTVAVQNAAANSAATAQFRATTLDGTGGDAQTLYYIGGTQFFAVGIDNSDSDAFKISANDVLGTNDFLKITTAGAVILAGSLSGVTTLGCTTLTASTQLIGHGTSTNDSASAGYIGEYVESVTGATTVAATTVVSDITSISLTAGDWDVSYIAYLNVGTSVVAQVSTAVTSTSGNNFTGWVTGDNSVTHTALSGNVSLAVAGRRFSLSGSTTLYAKSYVDYTGTAGTMTVRLSARRVR